MKNITVYSVLVMGLLLFSCKSEFQKQSIKQIDEMLVKTDELISVISHKDIRAYQLLYDTIRRYNNFFIYAPDDFETTEENTHIAYKYGMAEKTFKKLHSHYLGPYQRELNSSKRQLKNLKKDIKNGLLTDDEIKRYLYSEDSVINLMEHKIFDKLEYAETNYEIYQKYHPKVKKLVEKHDFNI